MRALFAAALLLWIQPLAAEVPADLAGVYDGGQMEMATGIALEPDGRFRYRLDYGALSEQAAGTWRVDGDTLHLTTEPAVEPPRFVVERDLPAAKGVLKVALADPGFDWGKPFMVILTYEGVEGMQQAEVDDRGQVMIENGRIPTSVVPAVPVYGVIAAATPLSADTGHDLLFRFEPNDLGRADFRDEPLKIEQGVFVMRRYGRVIRYRRAAPDAADAAPPRGE